MGVLLGTWRREFDSSVRRRSCICRGLYHFIAGWVLDCQCCDEADKDVLLLMTKVQLSRAAVCFPD